jgi:hypothetical protein
MKDFLRNAKIIGCADRERRNPDDMLHLSASSLVGRQVLFTGKGKNF